MTVPRIPNTLKTTRPGDIFLITIPNHWGTGATIEEAKTAVKKHAYKPMNKWKAWRVYSAHPDTYLDQMGTIIVPKGHPPVAVAEYDPPA